MHEQLRKLFTRTLFVGVGGFWGRFPSLDPFARPEKWGDSKVGFGVAMLPVGALWFCLAHFGRTVLPKWPLWENFSSTLYFTIFRSLGGHASARRVSHELCFCQAHCFVQGPLRFLPVPPNPTCARSHTWGFAIFGALTMALVKKKQAAQARCRKPPYDTEGPVKIFDGRAPRYRARGCVRTPKNCKNQCSHAQAVGRLA